jgi:chemotaxis response regulator CheB
MPREAILLNAVDQVLPLGQIPNALLQRLAGA